MIGISWIIRIVICLVLASIPLKIFDKKGYYSSFGIFMYGLLAPGLAIVHALILPDTSDSSRKQYKGKIFTYNVLAALASFYPCWIAIYEMMFYIDWKGYATEPGFMAQSYNGCLILSGVLPCFLLLSVILGRMYNYSKFVYGACVINCAIMCIRHGMVFSGDVSFLLKNKVYPVFAYELFNIIGMLMFAIAFVLLIKIAHKYGVKGEKVTEGKMKMKFIAPGLVALFGNIVLLIGSVLGGYFYDDLATKIILWFVFMFPAILFIGLFYYYDSMEEEATD